MAEISSDPAINYTEGKLAVKISLDYDSQGSEYTVVKLFSDNEPLGYEMTLHTGDMKVIANALKEYFS